jgi:predicted flap endonuclease-1-like 5' DNA nuclease
MRPAPLPSTPPGSIRPPPTDLGTAVAELDQIKRVLGSKLIELRKFQTEREALLARIAERDARIRELESASPASAELEKLRDRLSVLEVDLTEQREIAAKLPHIEAELGALRSTARRHEATIAERERRIAALEAELGESLAWSQPSGDDLKKIRGIGPKFERALNAQGVRTYAQIAGWSEGDIAQVAQALKVAPGRIERDGWVEAARALLGR